MKSFRLLDRAAVPVRRTKRSRTAFLAAASVVLAGVARSYADYTFTTLTPPAPYNFAFSARGISGNTVVGEYVLGTSILAYTETDGVYSPIADPLSTPFGAGNFAFGVSGNTVVGAYGTYGPPGGGSSNAQNGFSETGGVYTTLTDPAASHFSSFGGTNANGIFGNTIVGTYGDAAGQHGFIETGGVYTNFDVPGAIAGTTEANGIYGNIVVGDYQDAHGLHGFAYNITQPATDPAAYTTLDDPLASQGSVYGTGTFAYGISGDTIVGFYGNATGIHGFVETDGIYTTVDDPAEDSSGTILSGIDGTTIVGVIYSDGHGRGFVATLDVPEPASLSLLAFGGLPLLAGRRRSGRSVRHALNRR